MPNELDLEHMEARLRALESMVLSHIVASNVLFEGLAQKTVEHAAIQRDAATAGGKGLAGVYLGTLIDTVRHACDLLPEG